MKKLPRIKAIEPARMAFPFNDPEWFFEIKYDGFRALLYSEQGSVTLISKAEKLLSFPKLQIKLADKLKTYRVILDGEICSLDQEGRQSISNLLKKKGNFVYYVFDILWLGDWDLREKPLSERKKILERFMRRVSDTFLKVSLFVHRDGVLLFEHIVRYRLEGMIAKRVDGPYIRQTRWYKIMNPDYRLSKRPQKRPDQPERQTKGLA